MTEVIYCMKERVKIVREVRDDYLIEDVETGKQYLVGKSYFRRKYAPEGDILPVHTALWEKLDALSRELHYAKKDNARLRHKLSEKRKGRRHAHHH